MAELFQTSKQNIAQHLKNIFDEGALKQDSVVKKLFTTAADDKMFPFFDIITTQFLPFGFI